MKKFHYLAMATLFTAAMTSCSDDDSSWTDEPDLPSTSDCAYVLTQGNVYNNIEGGLNVINYDGNVNVNVFKAANKRSLGDTPQCGVAYGSKIYIGTSQSNTIEIIDRSSYLSYKQIKLSEDTSNGSMPWSMVAHNGKVYVTMYDGHVARLDTTLMAIDKSVEVGANPGVSALYGDKLYVPISDGSKYPDYGKTIDIVDLNTMTVEKSFDVGTNPTECLVADNRLYVLTTGNYGDIPSQLREVKADYSAPVVCDATTVAPFGNGILVVNQPFMADRIPEAEYKLYVASTGKVEDWTLPVKPTYVNQMYWDRVANKVLIASYVMNGPYPSYELPGYVNVYDGSDFSLSGKYNLGSGGQACIFTERK